MALCEASGVPGGRALLLGEEVGGGGRGGVAGAGGKCLSVQSAQAPHRAHAHARRRSVPRVTNAVSAFPSVGV